MDKKLRNAAEKITMPEDMKERIIKACENIDKTNIERIDNDGYTEVVSGTERISRRNNIIRVVSAAAACAVLAAGIGTTGVLLHKNHRSQLADSDVVDSNLTKTTTDSQTRPMLNLPISSIVSTGAKSMRMQRAESSNRIL